MNIFRLTFVLMLMIINTLSAQRDTEHWIAPYYNSFGTNYTNTIFLSTDSTTPFGVEIYSNNTLLTTVTISKGSPQQYTLDVNRIAANSTGDAFTPINKGVYLKATQPFFCNLRLAQTNHAEIITSKGKAGIGKEFYVASSPNLNNFGNNSIYNFTAGILATEDNTTVTVSWNTTGLTFYNGNPGTSHTFTLNKGQSFIFAGSGNNNANLSGFIGAKVMADKPVSLTNGSINGNFAASSTSLVSATDAILDQSVPLERLGNSFAMVKTRSTDPSLNMEGGLIVATENNTQIFLNGSGTPVQTLNAGQWYRINESNYIAQGAGHSNMYISTSKNVYLYQFVGVGNSSATCGFNYIPPLNCFLPKKIDELGNVNSMPGSGATPSLKLNILTEAGATVTVNGTTPTAAEGPYPLAGSTQWVTYSLDNVTGNLTINSSRALTAGINGGYDNAGYGGYFAGFSSIPIITKQSGDCVPGVVLGVEDGFDNYQWMLNGVDIPGATSHTYTPTQAGNYTLRLQNGSCTAIVTPIYKVFSCLQLTTQNINICSAQVITPAFTSSTQTPVPGTVTIVTPPTNGTAVVNANGTITYTPTATTGTDQIVYRFCGNAPEFIDCEQVTLNITIAPLVVNNASLSACPTSTAPPTATFNLTLAQPNISTANGATFTYYVNQADAIAGNANAISNANAIAYTSGNATIYVRVTVGTCFKVAELQLNLTQSVASTITASSTTICFGGSVTLTSGQATGNLWSTGATTTSITVTAPGTYTLTNSSGNCPSTPASITITAESDPDVQITGNLAFCQGSSTTLTATSAGTGNTYLWSNTTTGATNTVTTPGVYTVTVTTPAGCQYQKSVTVTEDVMPAVQNASLSECTNSTTATFNLTSAQPNISGTQGVTFAYYVNQADAIAGNANAISNANAIAYTSGNATIYVRVTVGTCFKVAELQLNITQTSTPTITASSTTICYGGSVTLTSSQANGNTWSNGATTTSITVTAPGTYTLTNSSGNCPSTPASITITAEDDPNVQITGNLILCESPTQLTASSSGTGNTYSWSNGTTGNTISVSTPGTYTVTVETPAGCQYQESVTVTQGTVPTVQNASLSECTNSTTATFNLTSAQPNISGTQGVTFVYYVNQADAIAGNANAISNANAIAYTSGNATIYVRVTVGTCFKVAELQLNITQTSTPTITASSTTICYGGSVTLTSSQANGNTWSNGATTTSITVTAPGTYTLTNSSGNCPSTPASITITAEDDPNVQITGNLILCESPTQLTASSSGTGNTYSWSNGTTGNTISVSTPGTYTVTVETPAGCQYQESVTVTQGTVPTVQNASLSECTNNTTATFDLTSAQSSISGSGTFAYYVNQADAIAGNANAISNANAIAYTSGNATIYVRISVGTCFKIAELQLNITQTSTPTITASSTTICYGGSVTLTSSQANGNTWSNGATTTSITVTAPGTYTLTNSSGNCPSTPASITITAESDPDVQITGNLAFCQGSSTTLTATSTGTGNTYLWSNTTTGATNTVTTPGVYTVTVTTPAGCQYQESVTVTENAVPVVQNASLSECTNSTTATFDLTSAQPNISGTQGVTFAYYVNQADAIAGNANAISNANAIAYTSGNAIIYVRITLGNCFKIAELQLNLTQTPTPTITASSTTICYGGSVTLTSSQATGNLWSNGDITTSITVTTPGTYTLTNSSGGCPSNSASITITAEDDPNVQITGNLILCESPTQLTASSSGTGDTYSWSNGTSGAVNTVTTPGTYTVTVTTPAGCQYQESVNVTQGAVPTVQNASLSECTNSTTATFNLTSAQPNISGTQGVTFAYYVNQADAIAGNANAISNANAIAYTSGNATIYVRVSTNTCFKIAELQLNLAQIPTPTITASSTTICFGGSVTLTSGQATGNLWSNGDTTPSITVTTPGTYTLTNSSGSCPSNQASITITAESDPNVQITGSLVFCQGSSTTLTATSNGTGNTYLWSNGTNGAVNTVTTPGTYTVTVTTPAGCQYQESVNVTTDPAIVVNIAQPSQITCTNSQVTLDATSSVYQPGATFLWTATGGGNIVSGANTLTPVVDNNGTYTLTITSTPLGCTSQASVTVIKNITPPAISVTASALTICTGQSVTLTASGAVSYTWTGLPGTGNTQTVSPTTTTTYTVTGVGANGCPASSPATITINVLPEIVSTLHDVEICKGNEATLDAGSGPNYTYLWSTGATTQTITTQLAGTYTVTISNGVCSKTFTATIGYLITPEILEIHYKNNTLVIIAKNNGILPLEYSIDGGVNWQSSNTFNNVFSNTSYTIQVRNKGMTCYAEAVYYTFFMANVITPNNDGKNDFIDFSEISKYGDFTGNIFDRYGKSVFNASSKNPKWDGKHLGYLVPTGTYWYKLSWEDRISKKPVHLSGWILLKNRN